MTPLTVPARRMSFVVVTLTAVFGMLASAAVFLMIESWRYRIAEIDFRNRATDRWRIINSDFAGASSLLYALRAFMEAANHEVTHDEFVAFSRRLHGGIAGLRDTGWAPRIVAARREQFENEMRATLFPEFEIRELAVDVLVRATAHPVYYPVLYTEGGLSDRNVVGVDLDTGAHRQVHILRSLTTGRPAATEPADLIGVKRRHGGILAYLAVGSSTPGPVSDQASPNRGVVLGAFDIDEMIESIVANKANLTDMDVHFFEPGAVAADRAVYSRRLAAGNDAAPDMQSLETRPHWTGTVAIMDQPWTAIFVPSPTLRTMRSDWQAILPLLVGLTMTAMIVGYLLLSLRRNERLLALTNKLREITAELHSKAENISHLARHDTLTGLPNRALFKERLDEAVAGLGRSWPFALLCLDLDKFKAVNDTLGHGAGDQLLCQAAERMAACVRETDTLARLGGDEFIIILQHTAGRDGAAMVAGRLIEVVGAPYDIDGHTVVIGVSVGIAVAPDDGDARDCLLTRADLALYAAKDAGRGAFRFFDPSLYAKMDTRHELEVDLRRGLERGELQLYYQPIVTLELQRVVGFEALARWNHPQHGLLQPGQFIPLAEESGLIVEFGRWALQQACADAALWPQAVYVAVNISPIQFKKEGLLADVRQALEAAGLPAHRLEIEITEAAMLNANAVTLATLGTLRDLGVRVAFDDFGTGFSSLSSLHTFPIDRIKVDKSFVADLDSKRSATAIVHAIAGLGQHLGLATTAEGIETPEQLTALRALGCTHGQGYLFGKPRPGDEVPAMLHRLSALDPLLIG